MSVNLDEHTKDVKVTVREVSGGYQADYEPKIIPVQKHNTKIKFHLDLPTPDDVVIDNVYVTPLDQNQLSNPTISSNRKHAELTDANTVAGRFHLHFSFKDKKGSELSVKSCFGTDPEDGEEYPIIDNNPP
jgi:hypothetical protein